MPANIFKITFVIALMLSFNLKGQKTSDFFLLAEKATQKMYQNPGEASVFIRNLLVNDQAAEHQLVLQYLLAQAKALQGDHLESVKSSIEKGLSGSVITSDFSKRFIQLSLAEQYHNLDLYKQSEKILSDLPTYSSKKKSMKELDYFYYTNLLQLKARTALLFQNYAKASSLLKQDKDLVLGRSADHTLKVFENSSIKLRILLGQKQNAKAEKLADSLLGTTSLKTDYPYLFASVSLSKARLLFLAKDYQQSILIIKTAQQEIAGLGYLPLESFLNAALAKNYFAVRDIENYQSLLSLNNEQESRLESSRKDGVRFVMQLVENRNKTLLDYAERESRQRFFLFFGLALSVVIAVGIVYAKLSSSEKDVEKQFDFLSKLSQYQSNINKEVVENNIQSSMDFEVQKKKASISKEKEIELLQKLEEMESSFRYMDKGMSLAMLAGQLDTNTKYLSEIINVHKGKNYNAYINDLRVNRVAFLLKTQPEYRAYKISYLADISGFSSHSSFATVFKSVTGMTPNAFIQQISLNL